MLRTKKIVLDGLALDMISISEFGLDVVVLNKLEFIEHIDTPLGPARGLLTSSKISKFNDDYSFIDIVPCQEKIESTLCARTDKGIIYFNREERKVFRSTCSNNSYSTDSNSYGWKQIDDNLVVSEDISSNSTRVSYFDIKLNLFSQEIKPYIYDIVHETALLEDDKFNIISNNFHEANSNISPRLCKYSLTNMNKEKDVVLNCYDKFDKKEYIIFFEKGIKEKWRIELNEYILDDLFNIDGYFYGVLSQNKIGHKWRILKISKDGVIVDSFDFRGADPILTIFYNKLAVVFTDIENFEPWQKELLREGQYVGPSAIIIVED